MIELKVTGSQWDEILTQISPIVPSASKPVETPKPAEPVATAPAPKAKTTKKAAEATTPAPAPVEEKPAEPVKAEAPAPAPAPAPAKPAPADDTPLTRDDVKKVGLDFRQKFGTGALKLLFAEFDKKKLDDFAPEEYPAVMARMKQRLEEAADA